MSALRRLMPDGVAGRLSLVLIASLLAANLLALAVLSFERQRLDRVALVTREGERIVSLVPALEATPPDVRPDLARAASTRSSRVTVNPEPIVETQSDTRRLMTLARDLTEALEGREVRVAILVPPDEEGHGSDRSVAISLRLAVAGDGPAQWLNVRSLGTPPPGINDGALLLILGLSLAMVLGVGLLFVRRLTRPLTALATAANAAGRGDRTARVTTTGPREMRDAAAAFNDMQARIARFDAERMRTLAAIGHDLRTPITGLRIRAEMLEPSEGVPMIRTLDEMKVMADGLVAYARGSDDSETSRDLDLAAMLKRICADRGASFDDGKAVFVHGRPVDLGRAIGNLLDNAIRYASGAHTMLTVKDAEAIVTIEDDGPGIAEDRLATIFDPFVRGDDSRNSDTGGVGLGLTIARDIVTAHGGSIMLENRAQAGLRAIVRLPVVAP